MQFSTEVEFFGCVPLSGVLHSPRHCGRRSDWSRHWTTREAPVRVRPSPVPPRLRLRDRCVPSCGSARRGCSWSRSWVGHAEAGRHAHRNSEGSLVRLSLHWSVRCLWVRKARPRLRRVGPDPGPSLGLPGAPGPGGGSGSGERALASRLVRGPEDRHPVEGEDERGRLEPTDLAQLVLEFVGASSQVLVEVVPPRSLKLRPLKDRSMRKPPKRCTTATSMRFRLPSPRTTGGSAVPPAVGNTTRSGGAPSVPRPWRTIGAAKYAHASAKRFDQLRLSSTRPVPCTTDRSGPSPLHRGPRRGGGPELKGRPAKTSGVTRLRLRSRDPAVPCVRHR